MTRSDSALTDLASYQELLPDARCPNCGSGYQSYRRVIGWYYYFCARCDLFYLYPRPSDALLTKYYSIMHDNYGAQGRTYDDWAVRLRSDFASKLNLLEKHLDRSSGRVRLLDLGCAYGLFLQSLPPQRFERFGCDASEHALSEASKRLDGDVVLVRSTDELRDREGTFDCVTLWATIEHLADPSAIFKDISRLLRPGGVMIVDTGLTNDRLSSRIRGNVQWFDGPQHLWVFTAEGMRKMLAATGFSLLHFDGDYERSSGRRIAKKAGVSVVAAATRILNRFVSLEDRKIPVGNLGMWVARRT